MFFLFFFLPHHILFNFLAVILGWFHACGYISVHNETGSTKSTQDTVKIIILSEGTAN